METFPPVINNLEEKSSENDGGEILRKNMED